MGYRLMPCARLRYRCFFRWPLPPCPAPPPVAPPRRPRLRLHLHPCPTPARPPPSRPDRRRRRSLRARAEAFSKFRAPAQAAAQAVGGYSNGCLLGGERLPVSGPGFEVLHLDRHRRFGHPGLVAYIRRLARAARRQGLAPLLIGDLSQPRGGPTPTGHRSHQSGLDVDIGFTAPAWMKQRKLTAVERETLFPPAVVDLRTGSFTSAYDGRVDRLIALAAQDPEVNRIFVNPAIKRQLCLAPAGKRPPWLRLVRPWWGHHDHLHVRLSCPPASPECTAQDPLPPGDGCGELTWWLSGQAGKARTARRGSRGQRAEAAAPHALGLPVTHVVRASRATGRRKGAVVKDRIFILADLMMGAAHADAQLDGAEKLRVRKLLREVLGTASLPLDLDFRIDEFDPATFDLGEAGAAFAEDPPQLKRKLLDLLSAVHAADEVFDLSEDAYLRRVGLAIGLPEERFRDLVATVIDERNLSQEMEQLRRSGELPQLIDKKR